MAREPSNPQAAPGSVNVEARSRFIRRGLLELLLYAVLTSASIYFAATTDNGFVFWVALIFSVILGLITVSLVASLIIMTRRNRAGLRQAGDSKTRERGDG